MTSSRPLSTTVRRFASPGNAKEHETNPEHRKYQTEKPLNPHITNTSSTIANELPKVGSENPPPDLISSVDPENTERMTGNTQKVDPDTGSKRDLGVGEMEGGKFKVEPLRRTGEDENTMRARLVCKSPKNYLFSSVLTPALDQSRKRGTLESDLLMSTFADAHLQDMTVDQMIQYDLFLDENDWDIYYWAMQEPTSTSRETAESAGSGPEGATLNAQGKNMSSPVAQGTDPGKQTGPELDTDHWRQGRARSGEWAQTIGAFKPAYRPVPVRWKNSEILAMLRRHVIERSAGGIHEEKAGIGGEALSQSVRGTGGGGETSRFAIMLRN
jgi:hypothetical protein